MKRLWLAIGVAVVLSGCAVKRDTYDVPEVPLPESFRNEIGAATAPAVNVAPPASDRPLAEMLPEWWTLLGSAELNELVARALDNNRDLEAVVARLAQARATFGVAWADRFPELSGDGRAEVRGPAGGIGSVRPGGDWTTERLYQMGLRLDWTPDLWGDQKAAAEAAVNRLLASAHGRDVVRRDVVAEVTRAYLRYLSLNDRVRVARELQRNLVEMLGAVEGRMRDGDATALNVAQQRAAVQSTAATIPVLEMQREQARNRLALLIGTTPAQLDLRGESLHALRFPLVEPGVPLALVWRRPDVRQAELEMIAADADIDVARALLLPTLNLSGQVGYGSRQIETLFRPESLLVSAVATLTQSLFDFGRREYRGDFARARHRELVAGYVQAVLRGVQETEDALAAVHFLGDRQVLLEDAVRASRLAYDYSRESYIAGVADYITLLDTERTLFRNEDDWEAVRFDRYSALIDLFRAVGGGTPAVEPPERDAALATQDAAALARRQARGEGGAPTLVGFEPPGGLPSAAPDGPSTALDPTLPPEGGGEAGWAVLLGGAAHKDAMARRLDWVREDYGPELERFGAALQVVDDGDWFRLRAAGPGGINAAEALCAALAERTEERPALICRVVPR